MTPTAPPLEATSSIARVACDQCHRCKLRCTRELPRCQRCRTAASPCTFSTGKPIGKPRGSKNKNPRRRPDPSGNLTSNLMGAITPGSTSKRMHDRTASPASDVTEHRQDPPVHRPQARRPLSSPDGWSQLWTDTDPNSGWDSCFARSAAVVDERQDHGRTRSLLSLSSLGSASTVIDETPKTPSSSNHRRASPSLTRHQFAEIDDASPCSLGTWCEIQVPSSISLPKEVETNNAPWPEPPPLLSAPEVVSTALSNPPCACDPTPVLYMFSLLNQAHQRPPPFLLDRSLDLLRSIVRFCERSLSCLACRRTSGMFLFLPLMHGAMCYYGKLLAGQGRLSPEDEVHEDHEGVPDHVEKSGAVVVFGGLDIGEELQGKIVEAVIRTEMGVGMRVLMKFEQALDDEKDGYFSSKVGHALRELVAALREKFEGN